MESRYLKVRALASVFSRYHSTAVLLPNGAVFTGGGVVPRTVTIFNTEIYYTLCFFIAQNPTIVSISSNNAAYNDKI
jgi:hypothetical protein